MNPDKPGEIEASAPQIPKPLPPPPPPPRKPAQPRPSPASAGRAWRTDLLNVPGYMAGAPRNPERGTLDWVAAAGGRDRDPASLTIHTMYPELKRRSPRAAKRARALLDANRTARGLARAVNNLALERILAKLKREMEREKAGTAASRAIRG